MGKLELKICSSDCAIEAAYHQVIGGFFARLLRVGYELAGRAVQNYPGEFIELIEIELSRYPAYRKMKKS